jgi:hypothetical protein
MQFPEIKHCIVCEDVRMERRGLVSLMGVYGLAPYVGIKILNFKLSVAFNFICVGLPIEGDFDVQAEIRARDGTRIEATTFPEHNVQKLTKESACAFGFRVQATFPIPDTYTLVLLASGKEFFKDTMQLEQGVASDFA